jgi:hypothetical protein
MALVKSFASSWLPVGVSGMKGVFSSQMDAGKPAGAGVWAAGAGGAASGRRMSRGRGVGDGVSVDGMRVRGAFRGGKDALVAADGGGTTAWLDEPMPS